MQQPTAQLADEHLRNVLSSNIPIESKTACSREDIEHLIQSHTLDATPWYSAYRDEFLRLMQFCDHETMDYPIAWLIVLPSNLEGDPAAAFSQLYTTTDIPDLMKQGVMEQRIPRHYVLLHDAADSLDEAKDKMRRISAVFGTPTHLLTLNSRTDGEAQASPHLWDAFVYDHQGVIGGGAGEVDPRTIERPVTYGCALSQQDCQTLTSFVTDLAVSGLIPAVELRVRAINHQVTVTRKGLKNQLKSLLFRKSSITGVDGAHGMTTPSEVGTARHSPYPASSLENQMRQLSDLAMALGDYETAIGTLRLLASDYKTEKAYKHYAGVQETLAAATILSGGRPMDALAFYKEAIYRYDAAPGDKFEHTRLAVRCGIKALQYLKALHLHSDAHWVCMKVHYQESNDERAGLLLEQAAHSLLSAKPPQVRKFAFLNVLAALKYKLGGFSALAANCYKVVMGLYSDTHWHLIHEHLHEALGKSAYKEGDVLTATIHFSKMLLCPQNSSACQEEYLNQFLTTLKEAKEQLGQNPVLALPVPVINIENVLFSYAGQTSYGNVDARSVSEAVWKSIESVVQPQSEVTSWLDGSSSKDFLRVPPLHRCCVGEPVSFDVDMYNPLHIELPLSRVRLLCSFSGPSGGDNSTEEADCYDVKEEKITLRSDERVTINLRVVPLWPGKLSVNGIAWVLHEEAQSHVAFRIPAPRSRNDSKARETERPEPSGIEFDVLPPAPRLEAIIEGLPPLCLLGQVVTASLRLRNNGQMALRKIVIATSSQDVFIKQNPAGEFIDERLQALSIESDDDHTLDRPSPIGITKKQGCLVYALRTDTTTLGPGEEDAGWSVTYRPTAPGPQKLNFVYYYEPVEELPGLRYRTIRSSFTAVVLPSLQLDGVIVPSARTAGQCLMHVQIVNLQGLQSFKLKAVRLGDDSLDWLLRRVSAEVEQGEEEKDSSAETLPIPIGVILGPEQAASFSFKLIPRNDPSPARKNSMNAESFFYRQQARGKRDEDSELRSPLSNPADLVLFWDVLESDSASPGFHIVPPIRMQNGPALVSLLVSPSGAIIRHGFDSNPSCIIPLLLTLKNLIPLPATVCVEAGTTEEAASVEGAISTPTSYLWCGTTKVSLPSVQRGEDVKVPLYVSVASPGVIQVQNYRVSWRFEAAPELSGSVDGPPLWLKILEYN